MSRNYLNLGCGGRFHPAWTNIDIYSAAPEVQAHDLRRGLPYADGSFEAVYSAHFLEHLAPDEARRMLVESQRILQPGGVIRVVVPDLEQMARWYLQAVECARGGDVAAQRRHQLATTLLLDQLVRTRPGGQLRVQITRASTEDRDYVRALLGQEEVDAVWQESPRRPPFWQRLRRQSLARVRQRLGHVLTRCWTYAVLGRAGLAAYREGHFRHGGEVHKWMYDGLSMSRLLQELGFVDVREVSPVESRIPAFATYRLDGSVEAERRPGSLYIEGVKP